MNLKSLSLKIGLLAVSVLVGCSNHFRESDSLLIGDDVDQLLNDIEFAQANSPSSGPVTQVLAMKNEPDVTVYVAQAPTPTVRVANLIGFYDFSIFGDTSGQLGYKSFSEVLILFFDVPRDSGRDAGIIFGLKKVGSDTMEYHAFSGTASIDDDTYVAELNGASGQTELFLESYDVAGDDLTGVIQLLVFDGNNNYLGKVFSLTGFR